MTVLSCATAAEAIARLPGLRCEVVLVGTTADATAADAVRRIREQARAEVVVIGDPRHANEGRAILRAGARAHIARDAAPETIVAALHAAAAGLAAVDAAALETLLRSGDRSDDLMDAPAGDGDDDAPLERSASDPGGRAEVAGVEGPRPAADGLRPAGEAARAARRVTDALSPRERELLRYLAEGYTNKEIARVMVLADDTVKKGVQSLIAKLGAADRTHAVVLALRSGLIQ